jgi:multicomponent Na+:H+ antiporter subunit G
MTLQELIGVVLLTFGLAFNFLGVVGVLRLPDTYTRLHASGKTGTVGVAFLCLGAAVLTPADAFKLIVLALFIAFAGPVASHAIAAAVRRSEPSHHLEEELATSEQAVEELEPIPFP